MKKNIKSAAKGKKKTSTSVTIGFIGAGNMAQAMMKAMKKNMPIRFGMAATDVDWQKLQSVYEKYMVERIESNKKLVEKADVVIIAVKPQSVDQVLSEIRGCLTEDKAIISIVAGVTIGHIQAIVGKYPVVRVMPNTPVLVGEGACAFAFSDQQNAATALAQIILNHSCKVAIEMDEEKINAVTAISGSGPAYIFYIAEAMVEAGLQLGLRGEHLKDLIAQTIIGAGKMIAKSKETPDVLRAKVTSKGGTTERAIGEFDSKELRKIVIGAVIAAKKRADELGK